MVALVLQ